MSSIYYKFKNSKKEFDTITFEGPVISVLDLKRGVISQRKFDMETSNKKSTDFDLVVTNAQTGEEYLDNGCLIQRNTSVMIRRVPATKSRAAKLFEPSENPVVQTAAKDPVSSVISEFGNPVYGKPTDTNSAEATNEDLVAKEKRAMWEVVRQTQPTGGDSSSIPKYMLHMSQPGPDYICHRCGVSGHWIKHCPTNGDKNFVPLNRRVLPVHGQPNSRDWHVPIEKPSQNPPNRVIIGGRVVERNTSNISSASSVSPKVNDPTVAPDHLVCKLCVKMMKKATFVPCCKSTYCDECIRQHLLKDENFSCPTCDTKNIDPTELEANTLIQDKVDEWMKMVATKIKEDQDSIKIEIPTPTVAASMPPVTKNSEKDYEDKWKKAAAAKAVVKETRNMDSFAKTNMINPIPCLNCQKRGHLFKDCPLLVSKASAASNSHALPGRSLSLQQQLAASNPLSQLLNVASMGLPCHC